LTEPKAELLLEFADSCLFASFRSLAAWRGFVLVPLPALSSKRFCLHQGGIEITANKPLTARLSCLRFRNPHLKGVLNTNSAYNGVTCNELFQLVAARYELFLKGFGSGCWVTAATDLEKTADTLSDIEVFHLRHRLHFAVLGAEHGPVHIRAEFFAAHARDLFDVGALLCRDPRLRPLVDDGVATHREFARQLGNATTKPNGTVDGGFWCGLHKAIF
jgi:hypothetical protein